MFLLRIQLFTVRVPGLTPNIVELIPPRGGLVPDPVLTAVAPRGNGSSHVRDLVLFGSTSFDSTGGGLLS